MKPLFISFSLLSAFCFSFSSYGVEIKIIGPCTEAPVYSATLGPISSFDTAGDLTVKYLEQNKIPYIGNRSGINSILDTPTGIESVEILSPNRMRVYGWCYSVNESILEKRPDQVEINSDTDKISWFYAYSSFEYGRWTNFCMPSYKVKSKQFCKKILE